MWQPQNLEFLKLRADIIAKIRSFFAARKIMEVETPLLCHAGATDPFLTSFETYLQVDSSATKLFLQTSPEFAMKRLLAAGSGPIYQLSKAFRNSEIGHKHNPEFTILEWYQPSYDHHSLMDQVSEFLNDMLNTSSSYRVSYADLFDRFFGLNPHQCSIKTLQDCVEKYHIKIANSFYEQNDKDLWLDLLFTHVIEPELGLDQPTFVYDYPGSQAALAQIRHEDYPIGERFEVYFKGVELANGYHELGDPKEQYNRFKLDNEIRIKNGLAAMPVDQHLLNALTHGLPACAGVALGVDRLIMLILDAKEIAEVISFTIGNA